MQITKKDVQFGFGWESSNPVKLAISLWMLQSVSVGCEPL